MAPTMAVMSDPALRVMVFALPPGAVKSRATSLLNEPENPLPVTLALVATWVISTS